MYKNQCEVLCFVSCVVLNDEEKSGVVVDISCMFLS